MMETKIKTDSEVIQFSTFEDKLIKLRDTLVLLDSDVANLFEVETKRINEAVKNNSEKFPNGYLIELTQEEWDNLKSKYSTSSWGGKRKLPKVFTELEFNLGFAKVSRSVKRVKK